jgi:hypothetical protein
MWISWGQANNVWTRSIVDKNTFLGREAFFFNSLSHHLQERWIFFFKKYALDHDEKYWRRKMLACKGHGAYKEDWQFEKDNLATSNT